MKPAFEIFIVQLDLDESVPPRKMIADDKNRQVRLLVVTNITNVSEINA